MEQRFLDTPTGRTELRTRTGNDTPVFFLPGHRNIFSSHKGLLIEDICVQQDRPLTHFAYYGWEGSETATVPKDGEGYLRHWLTQALEVFDTTVTTPQIIVGYSMGGPIALQLARLRPQLVKAIIGIAAGYGTGPQGKTAALYGNNDVVGLDGNLPLTYSSYEGGEMKFAPMPEIIAPCYFQFGLADETVSWRNGINISNSCPNTECYVWLNKNDNHRMQQSASLDWLSRTLDSL